MKTTEKRAVPARLKQLASIFLASGPVGALYALKLAYLRRRMDAVSVYIRRENEVHLEHMRALNWEFDGLAQEFQATKTAAQQHWKGVGQLGEMPQ